MHSYYNKLLPYNFDNYFISISSIHSCPLTHYPLLLSTRFYLESTLLQENVPLHSLAQKCGLQY